MSASITLTTDVIAVLDRSIITGNRLVLTGQLDRDLYLRTNKALEALGGKWNKQAKAHLFSENPADAIEAAILTGSVFNSNKALDFFPTPQSVVDGLIWHAEISGEHRCLEPSAGNGAIVVSLLRHVAVVDVCEIDEKRRAQVTSLRGVNLVHDDFMTYEPGAIYDRIVANPPFSNRRDIEHVSHMWALLKPGGRIVSVMASGITFRDDRTTRDFKALISNHRIITLDRGAFAESGTGVNAVIFLAEKPL